MLSPGAVTTLSTTGAAAAQAAPYVSLVLPCPVYLCSPVSGQDTLSSASQGLCLPELSLGHPPLVTLFGRTALAYSRKAHGTHWHHHGMPEFLKWEITKETDYLLERKAQQIEDFFCGGAPL